MRQVGSTSIHLRGVELIFSSCSHIQASFIFSPWVYAFKKKSSGCWTSIWSKLVNLALRCALHDLKYSLKSRCIKDLAIYILF